VPDEHRLEDFPYRPSAEPHSCGPTALVQALEHRGLAVELEELERAWGFRRGCDRTDTPGHHFRALRRLGIPFAVRRGLTPDMLISALAAGHPVVALLTTGRWLRHWVVVTGAAGAEMTLAWGGGGGGGGGGGDGERPRTMSAPGFESAFRGGALDVLMGTSRLGYCVGDALPWPSSRSLELYFRLQRPVAQHCVIPVVETLLGGLRRPRGAGLGPRT